MSLNKTLDRLFYEIRREAKRNPDFANRLDSVLRLHGSRRDVPDEVADQIAAPMDAPRPATPALHGTEEGDVEAPELNPVGLYQREGEQALTGALEDLGLPALQALVAEHNLDPSGATADLDRDALVAHVLAQAKRRADRDAKMFDY